MFEVARHLGLQNGSWPLLAAFSVVALSFGWVLLKRLLYPTYDPREPPIIWPNTPFIGHIISLVQECGEFYIRL